MTNPPTAPSSETTTTPLLRNVITAYLQPLLDKHEKGQILVWEDLASSHQAAEAILSTAAAAPQSTSADVTVVKDKLATLHKEQMIAYQQAAKHSLLEYARTVELPSLITNVDTAVLEQTGYIQQCLLQVIEQAPCWKVPRSSQLSLLTKVVRERAIEAYDKHMKQQQQQLSPVEEGEDEIEDEELEEGEEVDVDEEEDDEEGQEAEEDEEEEEGESMAMEETAEQQQQQQQQQPQQQQQEDVIKEKTADVSVASKKQKGILAKKRALKAGKAAPRKKGEKAKAGRGNRRTARRGRGGGGGGGGNAAK